MKKVIIATIATAAICSLGLSSAAFAEGGKRMERMQQELSLTDEQVAKIKALKEARREARQASREAHRAEIEALLTPEQKEKFSAMKEKRKHRMGKRGGRGHGHCGGKKHKGDAQQSS